MFLGRLFRKIDQSICAYLGLERDKPLPQTIEFMNGELIVVHTTSFKRHAMKMRWADFHLLHKEPVEQKNLEILGVAAGKALAKKLVVSFQHAKVRMY